MIKLQTSCVSNVPFEIYEKDFSFIVNGEEFKTNKIVSDLISPRISKIHSSDPTFDQIVIDTKHKGDFSHILKLLNFQLNNYPESELPFLAEIIEILDIDCIKSEEREITLYNVFTNFYQHEKHSKFYFSQFLKEIEFISSHFSEICERNEEELKKMTIESLYSILSNDKLQLKNEDELLKLINKLYTTDNKYSILYETVLFENVSAGTICEFISIYDCENMTRSIWDRLSIRLCKEIKNSKENDYIFNKRYKIEKNNSKVITFNKENEYDGIINYLIKKSNGHIENEINITASSIYNKDKRLQPRVVTLFDEYDKFFVSKNESNPWLCFDFKKNRIIPSDYSIRSISFDANNHHPKSWVVECSNDNKSWETVDEQKDCPYMNKKSYSHTFKMSQQKSTEFRYIRIRLTGPNWSDENYFELASFEIYGQFISN